MRNQNFLFLAVVSALVSVAYSQTMDPSLKTLIENSHNTLRNSVYISNNLTWSDKLAQNAYERNRYQLSICALSHDGHEPTYGENLAMASGSVADVAMTQRLLNLWISEGYLPGTYSHWTQMTWSGSTQVGCAFIIGNPDTCGFVFLTCEYYPAGNVVGRTPWTDLNIPYTFGPTVNLNIPTIANSPHTVYPTIVNPNALATTSVTVLPTFIVTQIANSQVTISTTTLVTITSTPTATLAVDTATNVPTITPISASPETSSTTNSISVPWPQYVPQSTHFVSWPRRRPNQDRTIPALYIYLSEFLRLLKGSGVVDAVKADPRGTLNSVAGIFASMSSATMVAYNFYGLVIVTIAVTFIALRN